MFNLQHLMFSAQVGEVPADDRQQGGGGRHGHGQLGGGAAHHRRPVFPPFEAADGEKLLEEAILKHDLTLDHQGEAVEEAFGGGRPKDLAQASSSCQLLG